jgi:hypothetical protein
LNGISRFRTSMSVFEIATLVFAAFLGGIFIGSLR